MPPGVRTLEELPAAIQTAQAEGKPIAFLQSDFSDTSSDITRRITTVMVRQLRSSTVMVYFHEFKEVPPEPAALIHDPLFQGHYIPKVAVVSPDFRDAPDGLDRDVRDEVLVLEKVLAG